MMDLESPWKEGNPELGKAISLGSARRPEQAPEYNRCPKVGRSSGTDQHGAKGS